MSVHLFQISVSKIVMIVTIVPTLCNALQIFCFQYWYVLSKTLAEAAAWKFVKENNMDIYFRCIKKKKTTWTWLQTIQEWQ